ncbi:MarR family transcriptional regulator [bacterium]|nr:MarR family transcriptional regulator [bacterium]
MSFRVKSDRRAIGFDIKMAWLAISRMYNSEASQSGIINTSMGFVLLHIDDNQGTPATKIAPLMGMEPRSLTRMLANMEEKKLVYRQPDEHDRRMVRIFPTEFGLEIKAVAKAVVIDFNKELYENISIEKLETFFEVLDSIREITKSKLI